MAKVNRNPDEIVNFAAGPAKLPREVKLSAKLYETNIAYDASLLSLIFAKVILESQKGVFNYKGTGIGVMGEHAELTVVYVTDPPPL